MTDSVLKEIFELARWAPSGDNAQPWRFEFLDESTVVVHGFDTREHCVYDLDGHASQIAIGCLLETAAIAASSHGLRMDVAHVQSDSGLTFKLIFAPDCGIETSCLVNAITRRSVERRAMHTSALTEHQKHTLESAVGSEHSILWLESLPARFQLAFLLFKSAKIRLTIPEAYQVHCNVIEWNACFSEDRIPDQALGVDRLTLRIMKFAMKSWRRVNFINRFLGGTWLPRMQMDFIPALACGAHFLILSHKPLCTIGDYVRVGRAVQRFWLTATQLNLLVQPEITPIIFSRYFEEKTPFSNSSGAVLRAGQISRLLRGLISDQAANSIAFMGRIGYGSNVVSRSVRKSLSQLTIVSKVDLTWCRGA